MTELAKSLFTSDRCIPIYPWLTLPPPDEFDKAYLPNDPHWQDEKRLVNWIDCRQRRMDEILPIAILIALLIILLSPKLWDPWDDYLGYGIIIMTFVGWATAEYRARYEYKLFQLERTMSGMNYKEFILYKKKNFGPNWYDLI